MENVIVKCPECKVGTLLKFTKPRKITMINGNGSNSRTTE